MIAKRLRRFSSGSFVDFLSVPLQNRSWSTQRRKRRKRRGRIHLSLRLQRLSRLCVCLPQQRSSKGLKSIEPCRTVDTGVANCARTCNWNRAPEHRERCKIAANMQHRRCRLSPLMAAIFPLEAFRWLAHLLPTCQRTNADIVQYSREGAQSRSEKACEIQLNPATGRPKPLAQAIHLRRQLM